MTFLDLWEKQLLLLKQALSKVAVVAWKLNFKHSAQVFLNVETALNMFSLYFLKHWSKKDKIWISLSWNKISNICMVHF